jgi:hypothetical protein
MMKQILIGILCASVFSMANAQVVTADSPVAGKVTVIKDPRLDILAKQEAEINKATVGFGTKAAKGYRLLVLSSNDNEYVRQVRTKLLQRFPEEKVYMTFQAPFTKLKFGNFIEKSDAERYKKMITSYKIVTTNVYLVTEIVEVKSDKNKEEEED